MARVGCRGMKGPLPLTIASSVQDEASATAQPSPDDVRAQLRRILADPTLQASAARLELLRFVVERRSPAVATG
jgi:hypothetical protein